MDTNMCDLPDDLLVSILRRLPAGALARFRAVSRSWHAIIDDRGLLVRRSFPPVAFPGVFTNNFGCKDESYFLTPPDTSSSPGEFRRPLFWHGWARVDHHCNGLLLLMDHNAIISRSRNTYVCNPATRRCARLPCAPTLPPSTCVGVYEGTFLAFDPAVSPHYEVFRLQRIKCPRRRMMIVMAKVFSSRTNKWKERTFTPEGRHGAASRCLHDVVTKVHGMKWPCAEYWRGSLYVCCQNGVLLVLRCSQGGENYDMVQLPGRIYEHAGRTHQLPRRSLVASYEAGVRYVELDGSKLQVWALAESGDDDGGGGGGGRLPWTLAHNSHLVSPSRLIDTLWKKKETIESAMTQWKMAASSSGPFSLFEQNRDKKKKREEDEDSSDDDSYSEEEEEGEEEEEDSWNSDKDSWNWDKDNFIEMEEEENGDRSKYAAEEAMESRGYCGIIGLHPYKDVLLFDISGAAMAYHLRTKRTQFLTRWLHIEPKSHGCGIEGAFPYHPCYVDVLPTRKISLP